MRLFVYLSTLFIALSTLPGSPVQASEPTSQDAPRVRLRSTNYPDLFMRHRGFLGELTKIDKGSQLDNEDSLFIVRPALDGTPNAFSLESVNYPGHFLRHQGFRMKLHQDDGSDLFEKDASFIDRSSGGTYEFESVNYPGHYIRHCSFHLFLDNNQLGNKECAGDPKTYKADINWTAEVVR